MKYLFDIGHPGHVHYFRNTIKFLEDEGHEVIVISRKRDIIFSLLDYYGIKYINRGAGKNSKLGKLFYMMKANLVIVSKCLFNRPDLFVSFSSPYAAQSAYLLRRPHIALNDTEHTDKIHSNFTYRFSKLILTPESYKNNLGHKQLRFNSIMEDLYLNNRVFTPDNSIFKYLEIERNQPFVFLRFVSWKAHHDYGHSGLRTETKMELIKLLSKKYRIFISSEESLPSDLKKYQINIPPHKIHSVLYFASLFIGESGTMASESSYLGTRTIYVNSLPLMCYLDLAREAGVLEHFRSSEGVVSYVNEIMNDKNLKSVAQKKASFMKKDFEDTNEFLRKIILNYDSIIVR